MVNMPDAALHQLCEHFQIDSDFFRQCLQESVVEIHEIDGRLELGNGTVLRLRQLERICDTLDISLSAAVLLLELTHRVAELEEQVQSLRSSR
jgi:hypothetical protein